MKKRVFYRSTAIFFCFALSLVFLLCGCGNKESQGQDSLYYVNQKENGLTEQNYSITGSTAEKQVENLRKAINSQSSADSKDTDAGEALLPDGVTIRNCIYRDHQIYLYFNRAYADMDTSRELLCRSGIVLTMMQVKGVSGISFFVDNKPLTDANGENIGIMTADSFAADLDPSDTIRTSYRTVTLYYASHDGSALVGEERSVSSKGSSSLCHKVLELLMEEPKTEGSLVTIPRNTILNSVTVLNDVCLVDFSGEFRQQSTKIDEAVLVYSIVDSLTSIPGIKNVQISVNGSTDGFVRYQMPYNRYYTMNSDLIRAQ